MPTSKRSIEEANSEKPISAILVVGSTGTGKSSTIKKCTGCTNIKVGDGHKCITKFCDVYFSENENDSLAWIDTEGWDDPESDDMETFQSILQFLNRHNLTRLRAILWAVHPGTIRQDSTLNKQAKLINMFAEKEIWNNVIIICKQAMNPEHEAQGALNAGYAFNKLSRMQILGYRFLEDSSMKPAQKSLFESNSNMRKDMNVLNDDEVRSQIMKKILDIPQDLQIIFKHFKCKSCGEEGDYRLLPKFCHMESESLHPGGFMKKHPKDVERYHPSKSYIFEHTGELYHPCYSAFVCGTKLAKYRCCKRVQGEEGCQKAWACCKKPTKCEGCQWRHACCLLDSESGNQGCETFYDCCGQDIKKSGCQEVCKKCGKKWGTAANGCFEKPHDLIRIEADL